MKLPLTIQARRANLLRLIAERFGGSQSNFATVTGISLSQIGQWLADEDSPHVRNMSERSARKIEGACSLPSGWLDSNHEEHASEIVVATQDTPPEGYIRLDHLPYQPSMGGGRAQIAEHVVQHIDVLESFVRQKVGSVSPDRIKILTGVGTSMLPRIKDQDIVFVDIEHRWIDAPGYYVIDVGGLLLLKKAMILSTGVLILRSENIEEYPDEERHDLRKAADTITVCGKVLAWWTLMQG